MTLISKRISPDRRRGLAAATLCTLLNADGMAFVFENDKQMHFSMSFVFGYLAETILHRSSVRDKEKVLLSIGVAMVPGITKELMDEKSRDNRFSFEDLSFDLLGATTGVLTSYWLNSNFFMTVDKKEDAYALGLGYRF